MAETIKIEISRKSIIFVITFLIALWFIFQIKDIILSLFVALLIMSILNPLVTKLTKNKIARLLSVIIIYILLFILFSSSLAILIPPLISESTNFVSGLPKYLNRVEIFGIYTDQIIRQVIAQLGSLPGQLPKIIISFFSNALSVVTVLILSFYLLIYREKLDVQLGYFFGEEKRKEIGKILDLLEKGLGGWARGQLSLMLVIWITTYLGLLLLGIPFALPLSILAGLLEIIPYMGPIIAAIPAVVIGFGITPLIGLATIALTFLIQQVENYVFVPKIMEKSVGVNPLVTIISLAIGFRLAGIVGVLISVPMVISLRILSNEYLTSKKYN